MYPIKKVAERYGVSKATIWRWMRVRGFPQPVRYSPQCVRWRESDLAEWDSQFK